MKSAPYRLLSWPFDVAKILGARRGIKQELLAVDAPLKDLRVAILGGSTTSELASILELFLLKERFRPVFYQSEYGRFYEDAVVDDSALRAFQPEVVIVHTTSRNIRSFPSPGDAAAQVDEKLNTEFARFAAVWDRLQTNFGCLVIQNNFEALPYRILGNYDTIAEFGKQAFIHRLNARFAEYARSHRNVAINDIHYLAGLIGLDEWHQDSYWYSYKLAVSPKATVFLADSLARILRAAYGKSRKCLVLDLDNTLWGGIIGDDGINNLQLGNETPEGEAFVAFQQYCRELKKRGVLLAVCSKNDPAVSREGFRHPDSILKLEDFAAFEASWDPKHEGLLRIANQLNLGLDAFVFVDDNPAEREIIRLQLPAVAVPDIGDDVTRFAEVLDRNGYFETLGISEEDTARSALYSENTQRDATANTFKSYDEYLASLQMQAEIAPFHERYLDRIAQLTNKTNQFNLTTRRYTAAELQGMAADPAYITLYGRLKDKFGDNGLISIIVGKVTDEKQLEIVLWLMSCRVLKRGMEGAMLDELVRECRGRGITRLNGYYFRTAKNGMMASHYREMGFEMLTQTDDESVWRLDLEPEYKPKNKLIEVLAHA